MSLSPSAARQESGSFISSGTLCAKPELSNANEPETFTLPAQHYGVNVAATLGRYEVEHNGAQAVHAFLFHPREMCPAGNVEVVHVGSPFDWPRSV